jgi:hypothetical protein
MKELCNRSTHTFFSILKKMEVKNERLHFWEVRFWNHISKFLVTYTDNLDKIMVLPVGIKQMKGEQSLDQ